MNKQTGSFSGNSKEDIRRARRLRRRRIVFIQRLVLASVFCLVILGLVLALTRNLPGRKYQRYLDNATKAFADGRVEEAKQDALLAIEINEKKSREPYRIVAGAARAVGNEKQYEEYLKMGYENTADEAFIDEYCVSLLNHAVDEINTLTADIHTFDYCLEVLDFIPTMEENFLVMDTLYDRVFDNRSEELFCTKDGCIFNEYVNIVYGLMATYEKNPSEELKEEIVKYAAPDALNVSLETKHLEEYSEMLSKVSKIKTDTRVESLRECLSKAVYAEEMFAPVFEKFESDDLAPVRDFVVSEEYISLRDEFLNGENKCWSGATYIPVNKESLHLNCRDNVYTFSFDGLSEESRMGVINIWAAKQEDDGVQRQAISYDMPDLHTSLEIIYLYSNVKIGKEFVPKMNYRLETRVKDENGEHTTLVGDWGGENEWTETF